MCLGVLFSTLLAFFLVCSSFLQSALRNFSSVSLLASRYYICSLNIQWVFCTEYLCCLPVIAYFLSFDCFGSHFLYLTLILFLLLNLSFN